MHSGHCITINLNSSLYYATPKKQVVDTFPDEVQNILLRASPTDLAKANRCYWIIAPRLHGQPTNESTPERTVRDWLAKYREAEAKYGFGFVGLIPQKNPGNHYSRYSQEVWDFVDEIITTEYETGLCTGQKLVKGNRKGFHENYDIL